MKSGLLALMPLDLWLSRPLTSETELPMPQADSQEKAVEEKKGCAGGRTDNPHRSAGARSIEERAGEMGGQGSPVLAKL